MTVIRAASGGLASGVSGVTADDAHKTLLGIAQLADLEPIGRSTAGVVYAATDLKLERRVSVRLLNPLTQERDRIRFGRESRLLGRLSAHPNVVTIYDAGFATGDRPFLIMELSEGDDLGAFLAQRRAVPWETAADIALQICAGLEQAHRSGALHRHLRPDNILMVGMTPKLSDFGISAIGPADGIDGRGPHRTDLPGDPGLWLHRAPEALADLWDERGDLYSVASILYELIDGHAPFWRPGDDSLDALHLRLRHEAPPPLDPELVPAVLNVFISAALSKDPIDRPQSADEFAHELRLIREGRTTGSNPSVLHGTTSGSMSIPVPGTPVPGPPTADIPADDRPGNPDEARPPGPDTIVASSVPTPPQAPGRSPAPAIVSARLTEAPFGAPPQPVAPSVDANPGGPSVFDSRLVPPQGGNTTVYAEFAGSEVANRAPGVETGLDPSPGGPGYHDRLPNQFGGPEYDEQLPNQFGDGQCDDQLPNQFGDGIDEASRETAEDGSGHYQQAPPAKRSTGFMAAVVMIALGLIGLLIVAALSALDSEDDQAAAPVLPDPNQPPSIVAGGDGSSATTAGPDAMAEEMADTTAVTAEQMSTTETTIPRYAVPNLIGLEVEVATRRLADAGFDVLIVGRKSLNAAPGKVLQQVPDSGGLVTLPLTVTLYIPKVANLPSMVGRTADAVCLELRALTLTCNRVMQNNDQVPAGSVIATNPVEGAAFAEGSAVEVIVSRGPVTTVAVPNVAGQTRAEAEATLMAAGFTVIAYAPRPSSTVEIDRAVGSNPAAATALATDQPVTVLVSSGPPTKVTVPELVGMTAENAQAALATAGLTATIVPMDLPAGDGGIGMVLAMDPGAGSSVDSGSAVTITVGRQQADSTTSTSAAAGTGSET